MEDILIAHQRILAAHRKWRKAWNAWRAEANRVLGWGATVKQMQGEPGTELRCLYEEQEAAARTVNEMADNLLGTSKGN